MLGYSTTCAHCGEPFDRARHWQFYDNHGPQKYCSRACYHAARRADNPAFVCEECGVTFTVAPARVRRGDKIRFCGMACSTAHRRSAALNIADRFWEKVNVTETCWLWIAGCDPHGYGTFSRRRSEAVYAHRFAYELAYGAFDESLGVLHRYDNPPCVRPDHLFLGTNTENMADKTAKGRQRRGEQQPNALLDESQVREIRRRHAGGESYTALATEYGVAYGTVYAIVKRKSWKHVE